MRVFHLITHFDLGGAERVAANIATSATPGMEYHVAEMVRGNSAYTPKFLSELRDAGVVCHRSLMPDVHFHFLFERIAALFFPLRMLYIMLRWRPDVIHSHTETPDMCLYAFSRLFPWMLRRTKIVRTIHNTRLWTGQPWLAAKVERFFCNHNANIAISDSVRDAYTERFGSTAPIIHNGVGEVEQKPYPNLPDNRINILFAGRLEQQKGIPTLCKVVRRLDKTNRFHFVIAGDGSLRHLVEQTLRGETADGMNGANTVAESLHNAELVPPIYSLASYMSSFDYLFMPSEFEGLSMLSMEASMNRLPVIANCAPGLRDTLPDDWPLMVEGNSVEAYERLFCDFLSTCNRKQLADKAQAFAMQHFSVRHMQEEYEAVYASRQLQQKQ